MVYEEKGKMMIWREGGRIYRYLVYIASCFSFKVGPLCVNWLKQGHESMLTKTYSYVKPRMNIMKARFTF